MLRMCHTADIHLDDRSHVGRRIVLDQAGRNIRGEDRRRCFRAVADGAIEAGVHLTVVAGDLYEHNKPWPSEECAATESLDRLAKHGPTILSADNHGQVESATERHAVEPLAGRHSNLYVSVRPEIIRLKTSEGPVQVFTLPSPRRSVVAGKDEYRGLTPGEVNTVITEKLRAILDNFRAQRQPGFNILVYHGGVQGAWLTELQQATGGGEIRLNPEDLEGFDYVALGDYHGFQQVTERAFYSGSTDRCSFAEEHQAKGWLLVELDHERTPGVRLIGTPARRYMTLTAADLQDNGVLAEAIVWAEDLSIVPVIRAKGTVDQSDYDALQPILARWRQIPTFSDELDVTRQTSARSAAMKEDLTAEASLRLWHGENNRPEDVEALLAVHRRVTGAAI